jgi:hypothetical protein
MLRLVRCTLITLAIAIALPAAASDATSAMAAFRERQARLQALTGDAYTKAESVDRIFAAGFEGDDGAGANCDLDTDGDTLPDCAETNTGKFVDITDTGTDPQRADTDSDGMKDGEELLGTIDGLDLPGLGVNPLRRDLLIEYDWFADANECAAHTHKPTAEMLARVAATFAAAPVQNPDGSSGINVIQDVGQGGALGGGNLIEGHDPVLPGGFDPTYQTIRGENFQANRLGYFRYVMLAHRYDGGSSSSGFGEVVGDEAIVTLNCAISETNVARTIIHEVGHNLGLDHGGFEGCNGKPNYNSLMNYRYQFAGLDATCNATGDGQTEGFSRGDRVTINEAAVDEAKGVCGNPAIDWNYNGSVESGIAYDVNPGHDAMCGGTLSEIQDFDDWANITLSGTLDAKGLLKGIKREVGCAGAPAPESTQGK